MYLLKCGKNPFVEIAVCCVESHHDGLKFYLLNGLSLINTMVNIDNFKDNCQ